MNVTPETYSSLSQVEKWEYKEQSHPLNSTLKGDKGFMGPETTRKCTDLAWLIFFIIANAGFLGAIVYIFIEGDVRTLVYGWDFRAESCGLDGLSSRKYMYYPVPSDTTISLCLKSCPTTVETSSICYYDTDHKTQLTEWGCWDSIPCTVFGYDCVPGNSSDRKDVLDEIYATIQILRRGAGDLLLVWYAIVAGVICACIHGAIFFFAFRNESNIYVEFMMRFLIAAIVEIGIFLLIIVLLFFADYKITYDMLCSSQDGVDPKYCKHGPSLGLFILAFLTIGILLFFLFQIYVFKPKMKLSVEMVKHTCKPIHRIDKLYWYIASQVFIGLFVLSCFILIIAWTLSMGSTEKLINNKVPGGEVKNIKYDTSNKWILLFVIFMVFWWLEFLVAISEFVIGGAVGFWYFNREKSVMWSPLGRSYKLVMRYHIGSVIRGALFNMLFTFPIIFFKFLRSKTYPNKDSKCSKFWVGICCPCLALYEGFLKYYTKYSYIYLAIFAKPYVISAKESYFLLLRNGKRIKEPLSAGSFSIFLLKMVLALSGFTITYILMVAFSEWNVDVDENTITSRLGPSIYALALAIYIAQIIGGCMEVSANAMVICGACDEEMFTREQRYIEKEFQGTLDKVMEEQTEQNKQDKGENMVIYKPGRSNRVQANLVKFNEKQEVVGTNKGYIGVPNNESERNSEKTVSRGDSESERIIAVRPIGNRVMPLNEERINFLGDAKTEIDDVVLYPPSLIPKAYKPNMYYDR